MTGNTDSQTIPPGENPAETMRKVMEKLGQYEQIPAVKDGDVFTKETQITLPNGRTVHNLTTPTASPPMSCATSSNALSALRPKRRTSPISKKR